MSALINHSGAAVIQTADACLWVEVIDDEIVAAHRMVVCRNDRPEDVAACTARKRPDTGYRKPIKAHWGDGDWCRREEWAAG